MRSASPQSFSRNNPLALAVLTVLWNQPMHPYGMMQVLQQQRKHDAVRLTIGALYSVVESLSQHGLIRAAGSEQHGHRPTRTMYALTDEGIDEATRWVRALLADPIVEYPGFMAGLSFLAFLPPPEVVELLRARIRELNGTIDELESAIQQSAAPAILLVEKEYALAITRAEVVFTRSLIGRIESGTLTGVTAFQSLHARLAERGTRRPSAAEIDLLTGELGL